MPWDCREEPSPARFVRKWHEGGWNEPCRDGAETAILPANRPWNEARNGSFWGPSVHSNRYLDAFVLVLNHTTGEGGDRCWPSEGERVFLTWCRDLEDPERMAEPIELTHVDSHAATYPQIVGLEPGDTDRSAGRQARLFLHG